VVFRGVIIHIVVFWVVTSCLAVCVCYCEMSQPRRLESEYVEDV
jgi:hypothetical protein